MDKDIQEEPRILKQSADRGRIGIFLNASSFKSECFVV